MSTSIRAGLEVLPANSDGALILLGDMQVKGRLGHLIGIDRDRLALGRILRIVEIADGETAHRVVDVDDQSLAGENLQGRGWIQIVAQHLPVRGRALDQLIGEDEEVLDGLGDGIEPGLALLHDQSHLEKAVFARER